jgi:DNA-3-methyladenine glycosylase II
VSAPQQLRLRSRGPFSLELAASFGFGPREAEPDAGLMRLAFCVDGFREYAGVVVYEDGGELACEVHGAKELDVVAGQVERILSLDHDGRAWASVGDRDPVIGELQRRYPGLRPVLFHSPYEAAAWSIISTRYARPLAARSRARIADELGSEFSLAGERVAAFPCPERLLEAGPLPGLGGQKVERLHHVARAALEGRLDAERLRVLEPAQAMAELRELPGIGPFYAGLVVVRSVGVTDVLPAEEPRARLAAAHFYGLEAAPSAEEFTELAEPWRPFRSWATVLLRFAWEREKEREGRG